MLEVLAVRRQCTPLFYFIILHSLADYSHLILMFWVKQINDFVGIMICIVCRLCRLEAKYVVHLKFTEIQTELTNLPNLHNFPPNLPNYCKLSN